MSLTSQHLYVYDGDLAAEDKVAARFAGNVKANKADSPPLEKLFAGTEAEPEYAAYAEARGALVDAMQRAIELSRSETVENVEERDGSRTIFTGEVLKADTNFEKVGNALAAEATGSPSKPRPRPARRRAPARG